MSFKGPVDYSLYLVTGREVLPPGADFYDTLEQALKGGVTIVQIREKETETRQFIELAQRSKDICRKYNVPILINDRIDVALAIEADGVHIGQSDMPATLAKRLLPPGSIIGVSANTPAEAVQASKDGADYVGIGPIWSTLTKKDIKNVLGVRGVGEIIDVLANSDVKTVAIAGINEKTALRTLHGAVSLDGRGLDGLAVVSAIMGSTEPAEASRDLLRIVKDFSAYSSLTKTPEAHGPGGLSVERIKAECVKLLDTVRRHGPLVHQITNSVVMNQSANVTLALGASPIMATSPHEMEDLSRVSGALLVNFGTISDMGGMVEAGKWANARKNPIVFDPVAVGATKYRYNAAQDLLNTWQASVIKGNAAEIAALANSSEVQSKGVDSVGEGFADPKKLLQLLARKERCVIAMTGKTDWVSDGRATVSLNNGHELLGRITGSGCIVGTAIAAFCAAASIEGRQSPTYEETCPGRLLSADMLYGAIAGILAITVASELAGSREDVKGPGTFLPALIDELALLDAQKIFDLSRIEIRS